MRQLFEKPKIDSLRSMINFNDLRKILSKDKDIDEEHQKLSSSFHYDRMLKSVEMFNNVGLSYCSRAILSRWENKIKNNMRTRNAINTAFEGHPSPEKITKIRYKDLSDRLARWGKRKKIDVSQIIWIVTHLESMKKPVPSIARTLVMKQVTDEASRQKLELEIKTALKKAPKSIFLISIYNELIKKHPNSTEENQSAAELSKRYNDTALLKKNTAAADEAAKLKHRVKNLQVQAMNAIKRENLYDALRIMTDFEAIDKSAPLLLGEFVFDQLVGTTQWDTLAAEVKRIKKFRPDSVFLNGIYAIILAKSGDFKDAHEQIHTAVQGIGQTITDVPDERVKILVSRKLNCLEKAWKAIDHISRQGMSWADENEGKDYQLLIPTIPSFAKSVSILPATEQLLQSRRAEEYVAVCIRHFEQAENLTEKLKFALKLVLKPHRRLASFRYNYDQLGILADSLDADWVRVLNSAKKSPLQYTTELLLFLQLYKELNIKYRVKIINDLLYNEVINNSSFTQIWDVVAAIHETCISSDAMDNYIKDNFNKLQPENAAQHKAFFLWCLRAGHNDLANIVYEKMKIKYEHRFGLLHYAKILQRQDRYKEACALTRKIYADALRRPSVLNLYLVYQSINEYGVAKFLEKAAEIFRKIPQPRAEEAVGIVLFPVRTVEFLQRSPLFALLEMKKRGWIIIPTFQGILPLESCGDAQLDNFLGCISQEMMNSKNFSEHMASTELDYEPDQLSLTWKEIDLSYTLREEASISRRRFTIDKTCPRLQEMLAKQVEWTSLQLHVLNRALELHNERRYKIANLTQFSNRFPDVVTQAFCRKMGDPESFFALQTGNGYQNYFVQFGSPISTTMVMRNMTKYPLMRSASFPTEEILLNYVDENINDIKEFQEENNKRIMVKVKSSIENLQSTPTLEKIRNWRAQGGRVACLFGKVICDVGTPTDGGPGHRDMQDWLNHSIESVADSDTLLLIKSHPHELNEKVGAFLTEKFTDLITEPMNDNVISLRHDDFSLDALIPLIDFGIAYNGTSIVELGMMGVPCIMTSTFAPRDYSVGQVMVESRTHYQNMLSGKTKMEYSKNLELLSTAWLHYMRNSMERNYYRYSSRQITNIGVFPPVWFDEDVDNYFKSGDERVSNMVENSLN